MREERFTRNGIAVLATALAVALTAAGAGRGQEDASEALGRRFKELAVPVATLDPSAGHRDLEVLRGVVGDASIVCLGESQHLTREQYLLKHRIVRFLVEEMDFTHIAIEDSVYGTIAVDDCVKGADTSPEAALRGTAGWYLWDTEEMLDLVRWLRSANQRRPADRKVSYIGIDIQDPWPGIELLWGYFGRVDPEYAATLESRREVLEVFHKPIWIQVRAAFSSLEPSLKAKIEETLKEVAGRLEAKRDAYTAAAGTKAFGDALLVAEHLRKSFEHFVELEKGETGDAGIRERVMFSDIVRLRETAGPRARIVVWVHDAHAAKSPVRFLGTGIPESVELGLLGTMLEAKYGDTVRSFGIISPGTKVPAATDEGRSDILDHVLARTGPDLFFLDLAGFKGPDGEESDLGRPWKLTADMGGYLFLAPAKAYDGLFFIRELTPVRRSPEAARRFKALF
jgi:erythromycin esterase